jgi:hypothetical protein
VLAHFSLWIDSFESPLAGIRPSAYRQPGDGIRWGWRNVGFTQFIVARFAAVTNAKVVNFRSVGPASLQAPTHHLKSEISNLRLQISEGAGEFRKGRVK